MSTSKPIESASGTDGRLLALAMPASDWDTLKTLGRPVTFKQGEPLFLHGVPATAMYLIETGRVEISVASVDGHKSVLNQMGPGEALGEIALLDGGPRSADAVALSTSRALAASLLSLASGSLA